MAKPILKKDKNYNLFGNIVKITSVTSFDENYEVAYDVKNENGVYIGSLEDIRLDFEEIL